MASTADSRRAGRELVLDYVFRPLSNLLVPPLVRARIPPAAVVLANAVVGLVAALLLARNELLAAAALLQVKTLLDNTDGQLARATGRVTLTGRYLDTEADLVVNAAVFAALGYATGQPVLAVAGFVALTLVLAVDFNATEIHWQARGARQALPLTTGSPVELSLRRIYEAAFAPLDRGARRLWEGVDVDDLTVTVLANFGLSTQLAILGVCLAVEAPAAYLWFALAGPLVVVALRLRAERRARRLREA